MSALPNQIQNLQPDSLTPSEFTVVDWQDEAVFVLDQRRLPTDEIYLRLTSVSEVAEAIKNMTVRGAPAIGVTAALGLALAAWQSQSIDFHAFTRELEAACQLLQATRPTAVNLSWALKRLMTLVYASVGKSIATIKNDVLTEARLIKDQDIANNRAIGQHGQKLLEDNDIVLTHCNAGALCSAGYGTALGVIYAAFENGKKIQVFADETRPLLQGARLTAWELCKNGIPTTVIADNMAASYMQSGIIKKIIVGADRVAANGDVANKIGTYGLAVLAKYHGIPFYVAAPLASIDFSTASGKDIPIEERAPQEISEFGGLCVVPQNAKIKNPAFDVTPSYLVTALITERGIVEQPLAEGLKKFR